MHAWSLNKRVCAGEFLAWNCQSKNKFYVRYDHSGTPEHFIIGLHKIKRTCWNSLAQLWTACEHVLGWSSMISTFHLLSLSLSPHSPFLLSFSMSFSHTCLCQMSDPCTPPIRSITHTCASLDTPIDERNREAPQGRGQWDRVCNMVWCDVTAIDSQSHLC